MFKLDKNITMNYKAAVCVKLEVLSANSYHLPVYLQDIVSSTNSSTTLCLRFKNRDVREENVSAKTANSINHSRLFVSS